MPSPSRCWQGLVQCGRRCPPHLKRLLAPSNRQLSTWRCLWRVLHWQISTGSKKRHILLHLLRDFTLCTTETSLFHLLFLQQRGKNYSYFFTGSSSGATTLLIFSATVEKIQTVGCKYKTCYYRVEVASIYSELVQVFSLQRSFCSCQTFVFFTLAGGWKVAVLEQGNTQQS